LIPRFSKHRLAVRTAWALDKAGEIRMALAIATERLSDKSRKASLPKETPTKREILSGKVRNTF
jgi:hypothetical protein